MTLNEMNDTATIVTEHDENEKDPEGSSRQRKEVDGHQVLHMIIEKAPPGLRRWLAMANHVLGDGGLGNGDAKLYKLAVHAGSSPKRIGAAHVADQLAYSGRDGWASGTTSPTLPCPIAPEAGAVPPDDRLGFHDDEDPLPISPDSAQKHPETAVDIREPRTFHRTIEDGELLAKSEILESQLATSLERRDERAKKRPNHAGMLSRRARKIKCAPG